MVYNSKFLIILSRNVEGELCLGWLVSITQVLLQGAKKASAALEKALSLQFSKVLPSHSTGLLLPRLLLNTYHSD